MNSLQSRKDIFTDFKAQYKASKESGDIFQSVLIITIFVIIMVVVGSLLYSAILKKYKKVSEAIATGSASPSTGATGQATTQAPAETVHTAPAITAPTVPAPDFPWSMVFGVLFSLVAVSVIIFLIVVAIRKANASRSIRNDLRLDWEKLMARHDSVRKMWSAYELDLVKIIAAPLMSDMRNPLTVTLHTALRNADMARPKGIPSAAHKPALGSRYEVAVIALEEAFHKAENESQRIKWNNYSVDEKKRLHKAQDLLSLAMNDGATEFERQAAYKALRKELDGLLVMPETTILSIESSMKLMIEA